MTRTQKLNLFTWALNDPVDLDQMNENFDRLDQSGRAAEAALWNSGILLMDGARSGKNTAAAEDLTFNLLTAPAKTTAYSRIKFSASGAAVPAAGQTDLTRSVNHVNIGRDTPSVLTQFQPDNYGTLTAVTLSGSGVYWTGIVLHLQISRDGELLAQSDLALQTSDSLNSTFQISCELDPNCTYQVSCSSTDMQMQGIQVNSLTAAVTPIVPSSGSVTGTAITVPDWAKRAKLLLRSGDHSISAEYTLSGENWEDLTLTQAPSAGGRNYVSAVTLPAGTQTMRLRAAIPGGGNLNDYMVVFY